MLLDALRSKINTIKGQYITAKSLLQSETENLQRIEQEQGYIEHALQIAQSVAQTIQQQAHEKIARVVSACLQTVFYDQDYTFKIRFERKRKKTEAKLLLIKDGHEIENPMEEDSGGVVDVSAFALQLSALMLSKPPVRRLFVMDEPFKYVSAEYRDNVRQMLEKLAEDFDVQFLMVTHIEELMTGEEIQL